jgi:hypothetical protein
MRGDRVLGTITAAMLAGCLGDGMVGDEPPPLDPPSGGAQPADSLGRSYEAATVSTTMLFEGTCDFLLQCSSYSRNAGRVLWGCEGRMPEMSGTGCTDSDRWVAGPRDTYDSYCGSRVKVCLASSPTTCAWATVRDRSVVPGSTTWEASPGLMAALGRPYSSSVSACSGTGNASVVISYGTTSISTPTVARGTSFTQTFSPGVRGDHAIDYGTMGGVALGGTVDICWRDGTGPWSCWYRQNWTSSVRRVRLWAGSATINFKITLTNTASGPVGAWLRQYKSVEIPTTQSAP